MNPPISKEQITYAIIDALLFLKDKSVVRQQIFQILLSEGNKPNVSTARCMIKDVLRDNECEIDHEKIQSCIETVQGLNNGFSRWVDKNPDCKRQFPARELIKVMQKEETVDWSDRWKNCGGKIYSSGRLAAPTQDSIWLKISDFGFPFPPFALNSGMGWMELSRKEFLDLGGQLDDTEMPDTIKYDLNTLKELKRGLDSGEIKFRVKVEIVKK